MKQGADGLLRATTFGDHMRADVEWIDDPAFAQAFARELESEIMAEETSEAVASIAARLLGMGNPLMRGGHLYGEILLAVREETKRGATTEQLDLLDRIARIVSPLFTDVRRVAASALTQHPGEHVMTEAAYTKPTGAYPGFINIQRNEAGQFIISVRADPTEENPQPAPGRIVLDESDFHQLVVDAQRLPKLPNEKLDSPAEATAEPVTVGDEPQPEPIPEDTVHPSDAIPVEAAEDIDLSGGAVSGGAVSGDPLGQRAEDEDGQRAD